MLLYFARMLFQQTGQFSHVDGLCDMRVHAAFQTTLNVLGKGVRRHGDDGHFAVYVGNYFPGYENAVIESVYGGVIIRELSESEAINDPFTHYGYMKGIDYTN